jgi:hypothetical protein
MRSRITTSIRLFLAASLIACYASSGSAATIDPFYAGSYTATSLGSVPGLPTQYGGLTFINSNTILIGGNANTSAGRLYQVNVTRDAMNHITGFAGPVTQFGGASSQIGDFNDGGVVFGPGGVLFLARWNVNEIGQVRPGDTADESKVIDGPANANSSVSALNFVPAGFGGAGKLKVVTYGAGQFYDAPFTPDGTGTYNIGPFTQVDVDPGVGGIQSLVGGPEGFVYIPAGNPLFPSNSMLIAEYAANLIGSYQVDADGNPIASTRRTFVSGLTGAEGAAIDPLTGDFLFSTFGGASEVIVVKGFVPPPEPPIGAPEPSSWLLLASGCLGLLGYGVRRQRLSTDRLTR